MEASEIKEGQPLPPFVYTDNAAWDTGAQFTFISPRIREIASTALQTRTDNGDRWRPSSRYISCKIGIPNGQLILNVEVYCSDIDDYDLLIGMDIITITDFLITNKDNKTIFQFRSPSEGGIDL